MGNQNGGNIDAETSYNQSCFTRRYTWSETTESTEECTVTELRRWLLSRGVKTSAKKSELVKRFVSHALNKITCLKCLYVLLKQMLREKVHNFSCFRFKDCV